MVVFSLCAFTFLLLRCIAAATFFDEDSLVKIIGHEELKAILDEKMTFVVAFVGSPCDDCESLAPQYVKTALGLYPFLPLYATDCQESENAQLCAEHNVTKFPTVKLFPRGKYMEPRDFKIDGSEISATDLYYFAQRGVPDKVKVLRYFEDIDQINAKTIRDTPRALLLKRANKLPLLWSVLANKYGDGIAFFSHRDWRGKSSVKMGLDAGEEGESKVLIYPAGEKKPVLYKGILKLDSLSSFFDSLLDGKQTIEALNAIASAEEFVPDPKLIEIEKQQETEMLRLAHGGFADLIDFEAAVRDGSAKNFHGQQGYPGMMGGGPQITKHQQGVAQPNASKASMTDATVQVVITAALTSTVSTTGEVDKAAQASKDASNSSQRDGVPGPTAIDIAETERVKDEL